MSRYEIIIYWSQIEVIIQEWIEAAKELGRPIPTPRGRLAFA